jgi:hypothetical protein
VYIYNGYSHGPRVVAERLLDEGNMLGAPVLRPELQLVGTALVRLRPRLEDHMWVLLLKRIGQSVFLLIMMFVIIYLFKIKLGTSI